MEIIIPGRRYRLWQLGGGTQDLEFALDEARDSGWPWQKAVWVIADRTWYLDSVLHADETADAAEFLECAIGRPSECRRGVRIEDEGHVYRFKKERLVCVKSSGGAKRYDKEWAGVQSQEVMRALIDHLEHRRFTRGEDLRVDDLTLPEDLLREALFFYEVRAWRRKTQRVNRKRPAHESEISPKAWRALPFSDVPFGPEGIELLPIDDHGHVIPEAA